MDIESIRKSLNLNQKEFAQKLGISIRSYQGRLMNEQNWTLKDLIAISQWTSDNIEIVFGGDTYSIKIIRK